MSSILPCSSILPYPPCLPQFMLSAEGGGGLVVGEGVGGGGGGLGGGGRGHFHTPAIYCTTTWCFALKGLRTTMESVRVGTRTATSDTITHTSKAQGRFPVLFFPVNVTLYYSQPWQSCPQFSEVRNKALINSQFLCSFQR